MASRIAEVVVVGSGFGGSVVAAKLAEAGLDVTLLERGPWRDTVPTRSAGIARRAPLPRGRRLFTHLLRNLALPGMRRLGFNRDGLYELHIDKGVSVVCASAVGGGSHVYSASHRLPHVADFWDNRAEGISDETMWPHYEDVLARMGSVTPTADLRLPNTTYQRYATSNVIEAPMPEGPSWLGYLFPKEPGKPQRVVDAHGIARDEIDVNANDDGFLGSPGGGKTTLDVAYLIPAMRHGLKVRDLCEVLSIERLNGDGNIRDADERAARYAVWLKNHHTGRKESLLARNVILAAGGLNTLRILLRSRDGEHSLSGMPNLGRRFGCNGDFLGWWDQSEAGDLTAGLPTRGPFRPRGWTDAPVLGGGAFPSIDSYPLPEKIKDRFRKAQWIAGLGVDAMDGVVSWRKGRLRIDFNPDHSPIFARIKDNFRELTARTGKRIHHPRNPVTVHPTGGACMGASIETAVVDANGEVFDNPGLYVADSAALPAEPGGPPSLTIAAWADHVATRFLARHHGGAMPMQAPQALGEARQ